MVTEAEQRESFAKALPEHLARFGEIVRESIRTGELTEFATFLAEQGVQVNDELPTHWSTSKLEHLRDLVILRRLDLKDLAPAARERLRARALDTQSTIFRAVDYDAAINAGETPRCRDCVHFVIAPHDGLPGGDKSCVELGAKGLDAACFGYSKK